MFCKDYQHADNMEYSGYFKAVKDLENVIFEIALREKWNWYALSFFTLNALQRLSACKIRIS